MAHRANGSAVDFITKRCHIYGRFGDKVYRRKRNGEPWVYDYVYKPKYDDTTLSRRTNYVNKEAFKFTNPMKQSYKPLIRKFFYYTPYFVYAGDYAFSCEYFFRITHSREYRIEINDVSLNLYLTKRGKFCLNCEPGKSYEIKCYINDRLYCRRDVVVIDAESDLEEVYMDWYAEHLHEVLEAPDPRFMSIKIYHRGIQPPVWINSMWGKTKAGIVYRSHKFERFMYSRQPYVHVPDPTTDYFYNSAKEITACWGAASLDFKLVLNKYCDRWFDDNYRKTQKIVKVHNLWSKLMFRASKIMEFDLTELSPTNWLPGVETIGDLLAVCGYRNYRLTSAELAIRIFINERP